MQNQNNRVTQRNAFRSAGSGFSTPNVLSIPLARRFHTGLARWGIYACFFLSGATALVFEVLWSRQFVTVFGNSPYAISVVLCAYMAGLGLGGLLGGWLADRIEQRVSAYGVIQAGVAAWAMAIPLLLGWLRGLAPTLAALSPERFDLAHYGSFLGSTLARFGLSFAILVVPCLLMGMTLPLLVRALAESGRFIGSRIGALYSLNALGASLGCLAAGYLMVGTLGLRKMNLTAVGINIATAIAAFALAKPITCRVARSLSDSSRTDISSKPVKPEEAAIGGKLLLTVAFLNGLAGLACEVLWIRYISFLVNSTYVFALIVCFYLLGLGIGGLVYGLSTRWIRQPVRTLGLVEMLLAVSVPATFAAGALIFATGPPRPLGHKQMAFIAVFLPAVLMGISFPLLCTIYGRQVQTLGRRTGLVFTVNTIGTVVGSLLPVFVLIPTMGIQKSIILVSILYGVTGLAVLWRCGGQNRRFATRVAIIYAMCLFLFFTAVPPDLCQRVFLATDFGLARHTDILFYREGRTGTAIVTRDRIHNGKTVYINGVSEVPVLYSHQLCFKIIGDLAPMLHPNPEDVLMICFGGGIAAGATAQIPEVKHLTIVDLEKGVVEAAAGLLIEENNGLLENPKTHIAIDDGRNYLMMSQRRWPVIVSDSTHPKSGDSWVLYTQEFYRLVREHLTNDGVFVQWIPTHQLSLSEFKIIMRTFQSVFPNASLWVTHGVDEQRRSGAYSLLAATPESLKIDISRLRERLNVEMVRRDLEPYGLDTPAGFLDTFLCGQESLRRWAGEGPVNTDDLPYTQYRTRYSQGSLLGNAHLTEPMEDVWPYLTNAGNERDAKQLREELTLRAKVNRLALLGQLEQAYALLPNDVRYQQMRRIYEKGDSYAKTLVKIYWDSPRALLEILRIWKLGGVQGTASVYEQILKLDPKNIQALNMLGAMSISEGLLQKAEDYLRRAVRLSPDSVDAHFNLGLCLLRDGRTEEAIPYFSRAVDIQPTFKDVQLYLALAMGKTGRTQEALPYVSYVLKTDPNNEMALRMLAKIKGQGDIADTESPNNIAPRSLDSDPCLQPAAQTKTLEHGS